MKQQFDDNYLCAEVKDSARKPNSRDKSQTTEKKAVGLLNRQTKYCWKLNQCCIKNENKENQVYGKSQCATDNGHLALINEKKAGVQHSNVVVGKKNYLY